MHPQTHPALVKRYRPYYTQPEVESLLAKQRGRISARQEDKQRLLACAYAESVGGRLGFPRKTIATAQSLYHRFHLFFPLKDFSSNDVIVSTLYVSCKLHDTLKKPRDILLASYAIRYPELLLTKGKGKAAGVLSEGDVDPAMLETDRAKLLSIERLVLETVCFNFRVQTPFAYVVKFGRLLGASKVLIQAAWRIAVDSHRTLLPLMYPPHQIALASIYTVCLLATRPPDHPDQQALEDGFELERASCAALAEVFGSPGLWEDRFVCKIGDLEENVYALLNLFNDSIVDNPRAPQTPTTIPSLSSAYPNTQPGPSPPSSLLHFDVSSVSPTTFTSLMGSLRLRASKREPPLTKYSMHAISISEEAANGDEKQKNEVEMALGRNEGTVRFMFG